MQGNKKVSYRRARSSSHNLRARNPRISGVDAYFISGRVCSSTSRAKRDYPPCYSAMPEVLDTVSLGGSRLVSSMGCIYSDTPGSCAIRRICRPYDSLKESL